MNGILWAESQIDRSLRSLPCRVGFVSPPDAQVRRSDMAHLFSNPDGLRLLASLRDMFKKKPVHYRTHRCIIFVCGGTLEKSLRKQFIQWAEENLPEFIWLEAEDALKDSFAAEGRAFVNLLKFETIVSQIADCVLIFPESVGSYAEIGFFAKSEIRKKTLVVKQFSYQTEQSFLNLGPIDTIGQFSFLKPITINEQPDFAPLGRLLKECVKPPDYPQPLPYKRFVQFDFKEKLFVVFEMVRLLRLAKEQTLLHALKICFGGNPQNQELRNVLRILVAAKFIQRQAEYFKVVPGLDLIEISHVEIETVFARVSDFYQKHSKELFDALSDVAQ